MNSEERSCPICLELFEERPICTPDSCSHIFCFLCLIKWAANNIECPLCRQIFRRINKIEKNARNPAITVQHINNLNATEYAVEPHDDLSSSSAEEVDDELFDPEANSHSETSDSEDEEYVNLPERQHGYFLRPRIVNQNLHESDSD